MRAILGLLLAVLWSGLAQAADLTVVVKTPAGKPASDVVVTLEPAAGVGTRPIRFDWPYRMAQKDMLFDPFILIVPVGATVAFPNLDTVRHHVYSFSAPHPFEIKLYGRDQSRSVQFDKPGLIAVGCNIHDQMVAFIRVVSTPFAAKTSESGVVELAGAPAGQATLRIWHPYLRGPGNEVTRKIVLPAAGSASQTVVVQLVTPQKRSHGY
jgi:plastocyanin